MGGQQISGRHIRMVQNVEKRIQSCPACVHVHHSETRFPAEQTRPRRTAGVADQLLFKNSSMNSAAYFTAASQMVPLISAVASFGLRM